MSPLNVICARQMLGRRCAWVGMINRPKEASRKMLKEREREMEKKTNNMKLRKRRKKEVKSIYFCDICVCVREM